MAETIRTLLEIGFNRRAASDAEKGIASVDDRIQALRADLHAMARAAKESDLELRGAFAGGLTGRLGATDQNARRAAQGVQELRASLLEADDAAEQLGDALDAAGRASQRVGAATSAVRPTSFTALGGLAGGLGVQPAQEALFLSADILDAREALADLSPEIARLGERANTAVPALAKMGEGVGSLLGIAPGLASVGLLAGGAVLAVAGLALVMGDWQRRIEEARAKTQAWANAIREVAENLPTLTGEGLREIEAAAERNAEIQRFIIEQNTAEFKRITQEGPRPAGGARRPGLRLRLQRLGGSGAHPADRPVLYRPRHGRRHPARHAARRNPRRAGGARRIGAGAGAVPQRDRQQRHHRQRGGGGGAPAHGRAPAGGARRGRRRARRGAGARAPLRPDAHRLRSRRSRARSTRPTT
ncbi:MAG: hypothetical protein M5R40_06595 [Anaerolineae bacterium]|nr:hypothetical protein [Anaerolineae bacterium]